MWYIPTCSNIYLLYNSGFKLNTFVFDAADDECALAGDVIWFSVSSSTADIEIPLVQWSGLLSQVICTEGMENSNQTQSRERHKLNWANVNECETREALRAAVLRERCNETRTAHLKKFNEQSYQTYFPTGRGTAVTLTTTVKCLWNNWRAGALVIKVSLFMSDLKYRTIMVLGREHCTMTII